MHVFSFFQKLVILNEYSRQMIRSLDLILVQCNRAILIYCSTNTKYLLCCQVITVFTALLLEQVQTTITMMYKSNCKKCYSYLEYMISTRPFLLLHCQDLQVPSSKKNCNILDKTIGYGQYHYLLSDQFIYFFNKVHSMKLLFPSLLGVWWVLGHLLPCWGYQEAISIMGVQSHIKMLFEVI